MGSCYPDGDCSSIYGLVYPRSSLSLVISFFILSKALSRFWSTLKIFLDAVPEGLDIKQVKSGLERLDNVASLNQLNLWTMDALEKMPLSMFV